MTTTLTDTSADSPLDKPNNYYQGCEIAIIDGTGAGQVRYIVSSDRATKSVTVSEAWDTDPDSTSVYKIYQLGKFPRHCDVFYDPEAETYHRSVPEVVKMAMALQVQFEIDNPDLFSGDSIYMRSEQFSKYSYETKDGVSSMDRLISPKAKELLRGIRNIGGKIRSFRGGELRS